MSGCGLDDCSSVSGRKRKRVFRHDVLNGRDPHRHLSNESVWLELKRPGREADFSTLSISEAAYMWKYNYKNFVYIYLIMHATCFGHLLFTFRH